MVNSLSHLVFVIFGIFFTSLFCVIGGVVCLLHTEYSSKKYLLALFMFLEALWLGLGGYAAMDLGYLSPAFLFKLSVLVYFLAILSLHFYLLTITEANFRIRLIHSIYIVGPILAFVLFFVGDKQAISSDFLSLYYTNSANMHLSSFTSLSLAFYTINMVYQFIKIVRANFKRLNRAWVTVIITIVLNFILAGLWITDKVLGLEHLWHLYLITGCFPILASLLAVRCPQLVNGLIEACEVRQYVKTRLSNIDTQFALEEIERLMKAEKLYQNSDITLKSLADEVDLSTQQLSELLNIHKQQNFSSFINTFRIEEAKEKLEHENPLLIKVAFDVGFQSVSSFNRAFKKVVGSSPSSYRKYLYNIPQEK